MPLETILVSRIFTLIVSGGLSLYLKSIGSEGSLMTEIGDASFSEGVGGSIADLFKEGSTNAYEKILAQLSEFDKDHLNHDLNRAARKAQLLATFFACRACLLEFEGEDRKEKEKKWLAKLSESLKKRIENLPREVPQTVVNNRDILEIFNATDKTVDEIRQDIVKKLREETYDLIRTDDESFPLFNDDGFNLLKDKIENGWTEQLTPTSPENSYDWFSLVCGVFNDEYKNPRIAAAMQKRLDRQTRNTLERIEDGLRNNAASFTRIYDSLTGIAQTVDRAEGKTDFLIGFIRQFREEDFANHKITHGKLDELQKGINQLIKVNPEIKELQERQAIERDKEIEEKVRRQLALAKAGTVVGKFIFVRPTKFFNRDNEFALLKRQILENQTPVTLIKGAGGFGKTSLADHFLKEVAPNGKIGGAPVNEIAVFNGQTGEIEFEKIFSRAADLLERAGRTAGAPSPLRDIFRARMPDEQRIAFLFEQLGKLGKVWFFFDNFESVLTPENELKDERLLKLLELAMKQDADLRLILTTREIPVFEGSQRISPVDMKGQLPPRDAVDYLKQLAREYGIDWRVSPEETDGLLARLAEKLRYIPKALFSFAEYFKQDREKPLVLKKVLENDALFADFLAYDYESGYARLIGEQFAVLSPLEQAVWQALSVFREPVSSEAIKYALADYRLDGIWRLLHGSGLIVVEERLVGGEPDFLYSLEQSAQDYVYQSLPEQAIEENEESQFFNRQSLNLRAAAYYYSTCEPVELCYTQEDFAPYFSTIDHLTEAGYGDAAVNFFNEIMPKLIPLGYMNEIIDRSRLLVGKIIEPSIEANNFSNLGLALDSLGRLSEAITEYDKAIEIYQPLIESGRAELANDLAMSYMNKGVALYNLGRLNEAITEYDKAIQIRKPLVESGRAELANDLAMAYLNKGIALDSLGKSNEAIDEYDKAIQIRKPLVDGGRAELANELAAAYLNKGVALNNLSRLSEAVDIFGEAIKLWENAGELHLLPNLVKAFRIRVEVLIRLENWEGTAIDVVKAFVSGFQALQSDEVSDHFKQLIGGEIRAILYFLSEVPGERREEIYRHAGELGEDIKQLVEDFVENRKKS